MENGATRVMEENGGIVEARGGIAEEWGGIAEGEEKDGGGNKNDDIPFSNKK